MLIFYAISPVPLLRDLDLDSDMFPNYKMHHSIRNACGQVPVFEYPSVTLSPLYSIFIFLSGHFCPQQVPPMCAKHYGREAGELFYFFFKL